MSVNGVPANNVSGTRPSWGGVPATAVLQSGNVVPAYGGFDYLGDDHPDVNPPDPTQCTAVKADGETCRARRAKGTEWCIGHLRGMRAQTHLDEAIAEIDSGVHAPEHP